MRTRTSQSTVTEQSRAIATAKNDLALRRDLNARINLTQRTALPAPSGVAEDLANDPEPGTDILVREAHRVLVRYLPGTALPDELWKARAMLDAHMFGRDKRVHRDDVVQIARQIDRVLPT